MKLVFWVKVVKEYDGCFQVGKFYKVVEKDGSDGMWLENEEGSIYCIPNSCLEVDAR